MTNLILSLLLLSSPSHAATGHSGLLLPGAGEVKGATGQIDAGAALLPLGQGGSAVTASTVNLTLNATKGLTVNGSYGGYTAGIGLPTGGIGAFGARWSIVHTTVLRAGIMGYAMYTSASVEDLWLNGSFAYGGGGVAVEGGAHNVFIDASVPLFEALPGGAFAPVKGEGDLLRVAEAGLNVIPKEGMAARIGIAQGMPAASFTYEKKHLYVRGTIGVPLSGDGPPVAAMVNTGATF